jgi:transcriptional regulator with XRE-family HTH domain
MTLGEKIRQAREARGLTQADVAKTFGINKASVAGWEAGTSRPDVDKLLGLARALGVSVDSLLGASESRPVRAAHDEQAGEAFVPIRRGTLRLSCGVTGFSIDAENGDALPVFFRREWLARRGLVAEQLLAMKVTGASMETGLYEGDTVVVNLADTTPIDGEVFCWNFEGECVIKRAKRDGGEWWLASDNPDKRRFPDKRATDQVWIVGRVVHKSSEQI